MVVVAFASLVLLSGMSASASAQTSPHCPTLKVQATEEKRKFHPGHYVSITRVEANKGFKGALVEGVAGVQKRYLWADLEPREGYYDFTEIERDLDELARSDSQLVALIEDKSFDGRLPTPTYLHGKYTLANRQGGYTALRWDPYVQSRLGQLVAQLGTQFDCHPNFEGIAFQESALSLTEEVLDDSGYTPEKYRDSLIRMLRSASESLPRSRVFWYMNFLPRNQEYISQIGDALIGTGVVMGGPDVLPDNPSLTDRVYPLYDEFRGRLRLFNSMQHDSYRHARSRTATAGERYWSMEELFVFARDELHVDYLFWEYRTWRKPADSHDWNDAREVIARHPKFGASQARSN